MKIAKFTNCEATTSERDFLTKQRVSLLFAIYFVTLQHEVEFKEKMPMNAEEKNKEIDINVI